MKVSVIIVNWNTPDSLRVQSMKLGAQKEIEIILIDNSSSKENIHKFKSYRLERKGYRFVLNKRNLGFAAACNQGVKFAKGEWLLFLNPDTHMSSNEILKFVENAENENLDAVSPKQKGDSYYKPLPTWLSLAVEFSPLGRVVPLSLFKKRTLFGGCLLIRTSVLIKLGGWDEKFFLWFEDSDLTKRLYDYGYKVGWLPVKYSHAGGSSFTALDVAYKKEIFFSSMNLYAKKHFNFFGKLVTKLLTITNRA